MNCFWNCLRRRLGIIVFAAIAGAVIAALLTAGFACIFLGGALAPSLGPGSIGITLTCTGINLIAMAGLVIGMAIAGALILGGLAAVVVVGTCAAECISGANNVVNGVSNATNSTSNFDALTCKKITAVVADLENKLSDARDRLEDQQQIVEARLNAVNTSRNVWLAALAAVAAAGFWNPIALAAAVAALGAASAAIAVNQARLASEQLKLNGIIAEVAALEGALASALATKTLLCGDSTDSDSNSHDIGEVDIIEPPSLGDGPAIIGG